MTEPDDDTPTVEFADWADVEAAQLLRLPINGKTYTIPALGHLDAIQLRANQRRLADLAKLRADNERIAAGDAAELSDEERESITREPLIDGETFLRMVLGDTLTQMRADNVSDKAILHAATVAHTDAIAGRKAARELWRTGISPEALAVAVDLAAAAVSTTSPATPRLARSSSMKKPASTPRTRSPKAKPAKSPGTRSSRSRS